MKEFNIGKFKIGKNNPTFIIAEIGSNHNKNMNVAKKLIETAAEAEVNAVKIQTASAETLYSKKTPTPDYLNGKIGDKSLWELIDAITLPRELQGELSDYAKSHDLIFISSPFDYKAIKELEDINVLVYKIASFELVDLPFLKEIAKTKKPILLSTGMASLGDIEDAVRSIREIANVGICLLHCSINYPPAFKDLNLKAIKTLQRAFQVPIGYSDHTMSTLIPSICVSLGARVIENHIT